MFILIRNLFNFNFQTMKFRKCHIPNDGNKDLEPNDDVIDEAVAIANAFAFSREQTRLAIEAQKALELQGVNKKSTS